MAKQKDKFQMSFLKKSLVKNSNVHFDGAFDFFALKLFMKYPEYFFTAEIRF